MGFDEQTDFEELASRIRTQSVDASGSDTERISYRSLEAVDVDALQGLRDELDSDGVGDGSAFVLSTANAEILLETEDVDDLAELEERLGHEVQEVDRMPDDTVLLLDPDAVEGEEVADPTGIACGMVGSAEKA